MVTSCRECAECEQYRAKDCTVTLYSGMENIWISRVLLSGPFLCFKARDRSRNCFWKCSPYIDGYAARVHSVNVCSDCGLRRDGSHIRASRVSAAFRAFVGCQTPSPGRKMVRYKDWTSVVVHSCIITRSRTMQHDPTMRWLSIFASTFMPLRRCSNRRTDLDYLIWWSL